MRTGKSRRTSHVPRQPSRLSMPHVILRHWKASGMTEKSARRIATAVLVLAGLAFVAYQAFTIMLVRWGL